MINQVLTIDLEPNGRAPRVLVHASQYDDGREVRVNLTMEGRPYELPEGATVSLSTRKPSGSITYSAVAATAGESHVVFALTEQMTAEYGASLCELSIIGDGQDPIGTANWLMLVEMSPLSVGGPTDSWVPDIDRAIAQAEAYAEEAGEKVLDAEAWAVGQRAGEDVPSTDPTYENNAKYYAGQASGSADEASGYAADAAAQATAAEGYAGSAAGSADNAAASAGAAAGSATEASGYATTASGYADNAYQYAGAAEARAENAAASAGDAADSASASASSAADALGHARDAESAAGVAAGASEAASASATAASGYASTAQGHAASAAGSASAAAGSASQASTYAGNASASATQASGYAGNASTSATQASGYADAAAASAADVAAEAAQIEINKEDISDLKSAFSEFPEGSYPDMTVGGLMSVEDGAEDQVPYTFRASGGGVAVGNREIDEIVGGTVAWNQLAGNGATPGTTERNGVTFTVNADGSVDVSGTASAGTNFNIGSAVSGHANHKQLIVGCPAGGSAYTYCLRNGYGTARDTGSGTIDAVASDSCIAQIHIEGGYAISGTLHFKPLIFDLTQMFGSAIADYLYSLETATAGAGVQWFKRLFPADYYAYDSGTLKSVEGVSAHITRGFNQWDEEWELGAISQNTGADTSSTNTVRTIGYIPVIPGARYYFKKPTNGMGFRWYDANKNYVGSGSTSAGYTYAERNAPSNASYLRFVIADATTYTPGTLCLNLSDPDKNGTYEPYVSHTYPLDSSLTLRGITKLDSANRLYYDGDRYASDGTVTRRYGVGTVSSANVALRTDSYTNVRYATFPVPSGGASNLTKGIVTAKYGVGVSADASAPFDSATHIGQVVVNAENGRFWVGFAKTVTLEEAQSALDGMSFIFELQTPTTEQADPFTNPQIVDASGTEEYVTTGIVPVGHYTIYPTDIVAKVDGLPSDFSTLIAPTETGFKASRAYSVNQFLIVDNQLYRVTASIASGATITPGTNVTACTVADILTQLLNA